MCFPDEFFNLNATGHSLGGAVALLCTLDLLHSLGPEAKPKLACVGFATPAVGNAALVEHAKTNGWDSYVTNYLVPGVCSACCCFISWLSIRQLSADASKQCYVLATLH